MYIAKRRMNLGDRWVNPGDPVPEAATWRNLKSYISQGRIQEVPDGEAKGKPVPTSTGTAAKPDETSEKKPKKNKRKRGILSRG